MYEQAKAEFVGGDRKPGDVTEAMMRLRNVVEELGAETHRLEERLRAVLPPPSPELAMQRGAEDHPPRSPLADHIHESVETLEGLTARLRWLERQVQV